MRGRRNKNEAAQLWFALYSRDYLSDPALTACSLGAQGAWMRMMCAMHLSVREGFLVMADGKPYSKEQVMRLLGTTEELSDMYMLELRSACVFSESTDGIIFSRRMFRDSLKKQKNRLRTQNHRDKCNDRNACVTPVSRVELEVELESELHKTKPTSLAQTASLLTDGERQRNSENSAGSNTPEKRDPAASAFPESQAGKGGKPGKKPPVRQCSDPEFDAFWREYPRKVGKPRAERAYRTAVRSGAETAAILQGLARWQTSDQWRERGYIPYPSTFLNDRRWEDKPTENQEDSYGDLSRFVTGKP